MYCCIVNDQPVIDATNNSPAIEDGSSVILTCNEKISPYGSVDHYEWYKNGNKVNETKKTYSIESNRTESGNYTCKVKAKSSIMSEMSETEDVAFLCKYLIDGIRIC